MKYRFGKYQVEPREKTDSVVFKLVKHAQDVDRMIRLLLFGVVSCWIIVGVLCLGR